jgi:transcriptional regulator GlxA family with amidase domain
LRIGFVPLRRFTLLPFAAFIDVLRLAADEGDRSRQIDCRWTVMSQGREPIEASCGTAVQADDELRDPHGFDYLVVVGGLLDAQTHIDDRTIAYLRRAAAAGVPLIGLCTAVFVLIRAGLMAGRRACVSWYHRRDFEDAFPDIEPVSDQLFVVDGPRITCAGGMGALDLAAWLVERHLGPNRTQKALHILVADSARAPDAPQPQKTLERLPRDARLRRALAMIEESLTAPPSASAMARRVGVSRRQFERLFRAELGTSPSAFCRRVRLGHGHRLLTGTDRPVTEIAHECGFADASHFARHLKQAFGASPQSLRATAPLEAAER